jgi:hypothetical protein
MSARSHLGALTAGFILIALGLIFLIENLYAPFSAWRIIARYWPVILIVIGLRKAFQYFTWESPQPPDQGQPRSE